MTQKYKIAAVIPCYKVKKHILGVIKCIGAEIKRIYVVDDACPEGSGDYVEKNCRDPRVQVIRNETNLGVGGAVMAGYRAAINDGVDILVKVDGDGQMNPALIPQLIAPICLGDADYTKGNRFYNLEKIRTMPRIRLFGNAILSLMAKLSTGYWDLFDPNNGFTAMHVDVARLLPFERISKRYFFESDVLFRLNILRAVVVDVPMDAQYGEEVSNMHLSKVIGEFLFKHSRNFIKRVFYNYYLRNMSLASIELPLGLLLFGFGILFGGYHWMHSATIGANTPTGTIMITGLALLMGLQFILSFLNYDMNVVLRKPLHLRMKQSYNEKK